MYQKCNRSSYDQELAVRNCRPNSQEDVENEIEIEKTKYEIKESINSSINNKGFLVQIGALIIFDDIFDSDSVALANIDGNPFEIKLDETGNISINGNKLDIESLNNGNKTIIIKNGKVSTV